MPYGIKCVCGETITVEAESQADAVTKLVAEMDRHLAVTAHPTVPKNLTPEQKTVMVKAKVKAV